MNPTATITIDVRLHDNDLREALAHDVAAGLTGEPKDLPPKWFYDARGSELFDEITRLPEYYPTEAERSILRRVAPELARITAAPELVELGSGSADKTGVLLDALREAGTLERYVPFDVSEHALRESATRVAAAYPGLAVHGVVGDFDRHLSAIPSGGPRLVAFLGGTIGNYPPAARATFLRRLASSVERGDWLVLGTDLVKDRERLVRAYDDAQGVTAEFNRNVLHVINRELGGDFDVSQFDHVAIWDDDEEWIEMRLRARSAVSVRVDALDLAVAFARGEEMRTEISAKFRRSRVERELADAGFALVEWFTDEPGDFALSLSRRV